ncbi:MAG: serine hydrolase [Bacteroidales bacterium]|jgi:CubicO group peptidase (beta-lactamase class C family)|nr:serine hydrolase [Bacteroidales bacterium]
MKKISLLYLIAIVCICKFNVALAQQDDIQKNVDEYIDAHVQMNQFSGSILIAKNDQIIVTKGYGFANYGFEIKNNPEIKFRIASLTKGFTAVAILQLEENSLLSVDDKLQKYIPDYPQGDEITIKHLLTHTSGIPNHTEFEDFNKERRVFGYNILETIETFKNKPFEFIPGEKFKYSNSNYILLGFIIEQVSRMSYDEYVKQNIFEPLKMNSSGFEYPEKVIKNLAQGYCFKNNEIEKANYRDMSNAHASGALYSTTEDLYIWDRALYSEELISNKSKEKMFTEFKDNYGFGWGIVNVFNHKMIAHSGDIDGFTSNISRFVNDDISIIILSNFEHTPINRINKDLIAIVFNEKYTVPEIIKTIKLSNNILQSYVGKYELKPGFIFSVSFNDGKLFCELTGQSKLELAPISESEFILKEVEAKISFSKNSNQEIEKLILHQGDQEVPANKIE